MPLDLQKTPITRRTRSFTSSPFTVVKVRGSSDLAADRNSDEDKCFSLREINERINSPSFNNTTTTTTPFHGPSADDGNNMTTQNPTQSTLPPPFDLGSEMEGQDDELTRILTDYKTEGTGGMLLMEEQEETMDLLMSALGDDDDSEKENDERPCINTLGLGSNYFDFHPIKLTDACR